MDYKLNNLLSSKHHIFLELLKNISESKNWLQMSQLSNSMCLSTRTIQRYINQLDTLIRRFNTEKNQSINFEIIKGLGVRCNFFNETNKLLLKNYIYEQDKEIQLLVFLLFNKNSTRQKYCEDHSLSDNTLFKSIGKINMFLSEFNLKVSERGMTIVGQESQIRMVCYSVAWVLFESTSWPSAFGSISEHKIKEDVDILIDDLHLSINYIKKRELAYLITIAILRYRLGFTVKCEEEWQDYFPTEVASELSHVVSKIFFNHHVISNEEIRFFTINMFTRSCIYENIPLKKDILRFIQKDTIVYRSTLLFLNEFNDKILSIPLALYDEIFIFAYRSHLYAHLYVKIDFDYNSYYLLEEISQKFPSYQSEMSAFIDQLFSKNNFTLFLEKDYLTQRYFMIETFIKPELLIGSPIKVSLETDLPEIYENTIKKILYDYFKYQYNLIFLNNMHLQKIDLTLTTMLQTQTKKNLVYFNYPFKKSDFLSISKELEIIHQALYYNSD